MRSERFAVIGDPIEHSLSPVMQAAAFEAAGLHAVYESHHVLADMLNAHVSRLRYGYAGFNVTVPHKRAIMESLDVIDGDTRLLGAVNTVMVRDGSLLGFNSDPAGFLYALDGLGFIPQGASAVVFGAGGAGRSVVHALASNGAVVILANRTARRAEELANASPDRVRALHWDGKAIRDAIRCADLIVNATSLGMAHLSQESPLPLDSTIGNQAIAFDLVYGRDTPFLRDARERGCRALDGLEMLVQQGAESFRIWTGMQPNVDVMRRACARELGERACFVS